MKDQYLISIRLIERLHRRFLDVIKAELDRLGIEDINNVQTLILFNINEEQLTVGELTVRGYYLGSNVSYNVKKLVENDYLIQERSSHDRRMTRVRLAPKGLDLTSADQRALPAQQRGAGRQVRRRGPAAADQPGADEPRALLEQPDQLRAGLRDDGDRGIALAPARQLLVAGLLRLLQAVELTLQRFHAVAQLAHLASRPPDLSAATDPARSTERHLRCRLHRLLFVTGLRRAGTCWRRAGTAPCSAASCPRAGSAGRTGRRSARHSRASGPDAGRNSPC